MDWKIKKPAPGGNQEPVKYLRRDTTKSSNYIVPSPVTVCKRQAVFFAPKFKEVYNMWVEEIKNGKFRMVERYTDYMTGKTKKVSVTMEKNTAQARKIAAKALSQKIDKALCTQQHNTTTLSVLVQKYREDQMKTVKVSTYKRNYHACNTLMGILGENTIVERMTAKYIHDKFLETGKDPGTLNEHLTRLKALIRWGYKNELFSDITFLDKIEPFKDIPHKVKIQDKYLENDELKILLDGMDDTVWRLLTELLVLSGLRFGEAAALKKCDVDFEHHVIRITKTFDSVNELVTAPKSTCSIRDVYMQEELNTVCKELNTEMLKRRLMNGIKNSPLFLFDAQGGHIHYYAYNKYLKENSLRLIGRKITPHALRHTHASLLLENGVSIDTISRRLGHENSKVTKEIYLHVTEKLKEKDNEKIAHINIL